MLMTRNYMIDRISIMWKTFHCFIEDILFFIQNMFSTYFSLWEIGKFSTVCWYGDCYRIFLYYAV